MSGRPGRLAPTSRSAEDLTQLRRCPACSADTIAGPDGALRHLPRSAAASGPHILPRLPIVGFVRTISISRGRAERLLGTDAGLPGSFRYFRFPCNDSNGWTAASPARQARSVTFAFPSRGHGSNGAYQQADRELRACRNPALRKRLFNDYRISRRAWLRVAIEIVRNV
jgi:hypothetical protein